MAVTGCDGIPPCKDGGNVIRTETALKISVRIPPTLPPQAAAAALQQVFTTDAPYGAQVSYKLEGAGSGWNAPALSEHLARVVDTSARTFFGGKPPVSYGEGGSIPFMGMQIVALFTLCY